MINLLNIHKKGAMFGLDARIALAIFGALSVISGAALYSAIQSANATALLVKMQEIGKAWDSYYLDTSERLPKRANDMVDYNSYIYETKWLVEKTTGVNNWQGPYLNNSVDSGTSIKNNKNGSIHIIITKSENMAASDTSWTDSGLCISGKQCYYTIQFTQMESDVNAKLIDKMVDGGDGSLEGRFRWHKHATQGWHYFLQIERAPNPND